MNRYSLNALARYARGASSAPESSADGEWVRSEDVPQWQPIESAPKDGTWVLAHRPSWSLPEIVQWCERVHDGYWQTMEAGWPGHSQDTCGPTHWMPLPASPVVAQAEEPR